MQRELYLAQCGAARREKEVIEGLFEGLSNVAIAKRYCINKRTVKDIIARLCARFGICVRIGQRCVSGKANRIKLVVAIHAAGLCPCIACRRNATTTEVRSEPAALRRWETASELCVPAESSVCEEVHVE